MDYFGGASFMLIIKLLQHASVTLQQQAYATGTRMVNLFTVKPG
jgi:hypothetical protein